MGGEEKLLHSIETLQQTKKKNISNKENPYYTKKRTHTHSSLLR